MPVPEMWALVLPAVAAVALGVSGGVVQRHLRPRAAVLILTVLAVSVTAAVVAALGLVAIGYLAQVPWVAAYSGWCRSLARSHDAVPAWAGLASLAGLLAMTVAVASRARRWHRTVAGLAHDGPLEVLSTPEPLAFVVPGRPGHIAVSLGLLDLLSAAERRVLFAHEGSHLRHRHHRYVAVTELMAAALPVLRPLSTHLRFATERWADEDAAAAVGDRHLVARAIARAALGASVGAPAILALAQHGVAARVEALVSDQPSWRAVEASLTVALVAVVVATATSTLQLHHLLAFAAHVCRL